MGRNVSFVFEKVVTLFFLVALLLAWCLGVWVSMCWNLCFVVDVLMLMFIVDV